MDTLIRPSTSNEIRPMQALFLAENRFQFIHYKYHDFHWADCFLFQVGETAIGYGATWGRTHREERDCIFEFYLLPPFRSNADRVFGQFCSTSRASFISAQTNDPLLSAMFHQYAKNIVAEAILFEDAYTTYFEPPGVTFRPRLPQDDIPDELTGYVLEKDGIIVGTGGFVLNYNLPYIDMFMQVNEAVQRKGYGAFIIQQLKWEAYRIGRVPAARCNIHNNASKATLLKAGMKICGFLLAGSVA